MNRRLPTIAWLLVGVGACTRTAPDEVDPAQTPTLLGASPSTALQGRSVTFELSALHTHFSAESVVTTDDAALRVGSVTAVSGALLRVQLLVGPAGSGQGVAREGLHAVTVATKRPNDVTEQLEVASALEVLPSLEAITLDAQLQPGGVLPQGGYRPVRLKRLDASPRVLPGQSEVRWDGGRIDALVSVADDTELGMAQADLRAGAVAPVVLRTSATLSGPGQVFATARGPTVTERSPTPWSGSEQTGSLERYETALYGLPALASPRLVTFRLAQPGFVGVEVLPESGAWRDALPLASTTLQSNGAATIKRVTAFVPGGAASLVVANTASGSSPRAFRVFELSQQPVTSSSVAPGSLASPAEVLVPASGALSIVATFTPEAQRHVFELIVPTPSGPVTVETAPTQVDPLHQTNVAWVRGRCGTGSPTVVDQDRFDGVTIEPQASPRLCVIVESAADAAAGGSETGEYRLMIWSGR